MFVYHNVKDGYIVNTISTMTSLTGATHVVRLSEQTASQYQQHLFQKKPSRQSVSWPLSYPPASSASHPPHTPSCILRPEFLRRSYSSPREMPGAGYQQLPGDSRLRCSQCTARHSSLPDARLDTAQAPRHLARRRSGAIRPWLGGGARRRTRPRLCGWSLRSWMRPWGR
jgi:hypothetical protein